MLLVVVHKLVAVLLGVIAALACSRMMIVLVRGRWDRVSEWLALAAAFAFAAAGLWRLSQQKS